VLRLWENGLSSPFGFRRTRVGKPVLRLRENGLSSPFGFRKTRVGKPVLRLRENGLSSPFGFRKTRVGKPVLRLRENGLSSPFGFRKTRVGKPVLRLRENGLSSPFGFSKDTGRKTRAPSLRRERFADRFAAKRKKDREYHSRDHASQQSPRPAPRELPGHGVRHNGSLRSVRRKSMLVAPRAHQPRRGGIDQNSRRLDLQPPSVPSGELSEPACGHDKDSPGLGGAPLHPRSEERRNQRFQVPRIRDKRECRMVPDRKIHRERESRSTHICNYA